MIRALTSLLVSLVVSASSSSEKLLRVTESGAFSVLVDGEQWFSSSSVFVRANNRLYSTADGSLLFQDETVSPGESALGAYMKHSLRWSSPCGAVEFRGNILEFDQFLVFEQEYLSPLENTTSGDIDAVISSFPSFDLGDSQNKQGVGFAQWVSWYYPDQEETYDRDRRRTLVAPGFDSPLVGRWNDVSANISDGLAGSGVICIFEANKSRNRAVVLSPFNNFMVASHEYFPEEASLSYGIMGNVTNIPAAFSLKTILYVGNGINGVMSDWGSLMRSHYGKEDARVAYQKDVTLQYLGYTTDNGAYYYYNTVKDKNYQDTMIAIKDYADEVDIPYKYALLDSWFYYRGSNDGVKEWDAMPDIFPDGMSAFYDSTGWLLQAHNRYWSPDTVYALQNGGAYEFIIDKVNDGAAPTDESFWEYLLDVPSSSWGLRVYEQDWLFNEMLYVGDMLESTSRARSWLQQMGHGALKHNLTIQYCMPYVRHLLQSLEVEAVTQARASDDYKPSEDSGQWRIGGQSILIHALGLAPSKDGVYSVSVQDGNPYGVEEGEVLEPFPRLQSAVAVLSAGPIAIADGIGFSDANLILKSCMTDGRLLSPSKPARSIDATIQHAALGEVGVSGEVWIAETIIDSRHFFYLFAAEVAEESFLYPADLSLDPNVVYFVYEANDTSLIWRFSSSEPLHLECCEKGDFRLWTITPQEEEGLTLQGEFNKWVSVSEARISSISHGANGDMSVVVYGVADEAISIGFIDSNSLSQIVVSCTFNGSTHSKKQIPSSLHSGKSTMSYLSMYVSSNGTCF